MTAPTLPRGDLATLLALREAELAEPVHARDPRTIAAVNAQLHKMREAGWSLADLAGPLGVQRSTISRRARGQYEVRNAIARAQVDVFRARPGRFACDLCGDVLGFEAALDEHMLDEHPESP